mgnify:CR=1 FL=1
MLLLISALATVIFAVEATFTGFYISSFSYNADSVTADLSMVDYEREPFPMHSFTPAYFPGMF